MSSPPRRRRAQPRAAATRAAIREASLRILRDEGAAGLTTNRIAEVAGVSIGSLYHHYRDKYAIAADICDAVLLAELDKLDEYTRQAFAISRVSLDETLRFFVREIVGRHRTLYRQLGQYYLDIHARYDLERWMVQHHPGRMLTADWLPVVFERHRAELGVTDFGLAAAMVVNALHGTIHATLDATPALLLEERFVDELHALLMRYLRNR